MAMRLSRSIVGEAEADAVRRVIREDGYLGMGSEVQRFERDLATYLGVAEDHVITTNSGTAALHLAVQAILDCVPPVSDGQAEILVPSLTFVASFQAIGAGGGTPVPCEIRPDTGTIDLEDAARRLTPRTRAIMPVHYASNPADLDAVYAFAAERDLRVIEDAAHAFGCRWKGRRIGSFGDVICFSFDGIKNITCGEGGCIVTADTAVAALCRDARLLSVKNDSEKRFAGSRSWDFDVDRQGWRYHMSNIMAAIGRTQLARLDGEFAPARRALAARYRERLKDLAGVRPLTPAPEAEIIPHIFPVRIAGGLRQAVADALAARGIPTGRHYKPNHLLSLYGGGRLSLPVTEQFFAEILTLPLHPGLTSEDVDAVCDSIAGVVEKGRTHCTRSFSA